MKNILLLIGILGISLNAHAQSPTVTFTATPSTICAKGSITFTNTATNYPILWTWYFPGGNPSIDTNSIAPGNPYTAIVYNTPGTYYVTCVVKNIVGIDSVTQQNCVTVKPLPKATIEPPSGGICDVSGGMAFDTVFFSITDSTPENKYSWAPASSLTCSACPNPGASPTVTTVYTLTVTDMDGCSIELNDTVTAGAIYARITGRDTICKGDTDTLIASGGSVRGPDSNSNNPGTTYLWSNGATTSSIVVNPNTSTVYLVHIITGSAPCTADNTFTVNVVSCSLDVPEIKEQARVSVFPNPSSGQFTFSFSHPADIAGSQTIQIYNVLGEKVYSNYQITNPGSYRESNYQINLTAQPNGIYFYRVIAENGSLVGEGKLVIER